MHALFIEKRSADSARARGHARTRVKGCAQCHVESASAAKSREITRRRARSTPRPPIRAITEATFSSELLLVANQTLAAYSLVDDGSIARKSEASPCVVHSKAKC